MSNSERMTTSRWHDSVLRNECFCVSADAVIYASIDPKKFIDRQGQGAAGFVVINKQSRALIDTGIQHTPI